MPTPPTQSTGLSLAECQAPVLDWSEVGGVLERTRLVVRAAPFGPSWTPCHGSPDRFTHAGWRGPVALAEGTVEIGDIGKAGVERDRPDSRGGFPCSDKQTMRASKSLFEHEFRERSAVRSKQHLYVARCDALARSDRDH